MLVLLAALLPFRGAVAEVLLCAGHAGHAVAAAPDCEPAAAHHATQDEAADTDDDHAATPGGVAKCNTCTASCSMSPLAAEPPTLPAPLPQPDRRTAHHDAPAPSHLTDGQERPPRSI